MKVDSVCLQTYASNLYYQFDCVDIPFHLFGPCCSDCNSLSKSDGSVIDVYYDAVIKYACLQCIPGHVKTYADYAVPGWNDFVKDKHMASRDAFVIRYMLVNPDKDTRKY